MSTLHDLRDIESVLARLTTEHTAQWGSMNPQQMVEHLIDSLRASRGIPELPVLADERRLAVARRFLLSDQPLPRNVDNPLMARVQPLQYSSLGEAVNAFAGELDGFHRFFAANPSAVFAHPFFGVLTFGEWIVFHRKHFRHHCEQFGLFQDETELQ